MRIVKSKEPMRPNEAPLGCDTKIGYEAMGEDLPTPCRGELAAWFVPFHGRFILCAGHAEDLAMDGGS